MSKFYRWAMLAAFIFSLMVLPASANPILVSQGPWGQNTDTTIMDNVFGVGNYTFYNSYAAALPGSVFTPANGFVWLEGGDGTDTVWQTYIAANSATILNWVNSGGRLLMMSAGWAGLTTPLGPGALIENNLANCGTLTPAGIAAFPTTAINQCGNFLAHDSVSGPGLTVFMNGNGLPIVAGTPFGAGYIMYSGLTDFQWHANGPSLLNDVVTYTAAVPEPGAAVLFATGLLFLGVALRKRRQR